MEFSGATVPCVANISPTTVRSLLGVQAEAHKGKIVCTSPLSVDAMSGAFTEPLLDDRRVRDRILRRLFLIILWGCFLADNSSTDCIGEYDWGSYTFSYFLRGMNMRSQGLTEAWLGF